MLGFPFAPTVVSCVYKHCNSNFYRELHFSRSVRAFFRFSSLRFKVSLSRSWSTLCCNTIRCVYCYIFLGYGRTNCVISLIEDCSRFRIVRQKSISNSYVNLRESRLSVYSARIMKMCVSGDEIDLPLLGFIFAKMFDSVNLLNEDLNRICFSFNQLDYSWFWLDR